MVAIPTSVIVVSRHRSAALQRCLIGIAQSDHPNFELIVVADPDGIEAARSLGLVAKYIKFGEANISAARNVGLAHASGRVVAFIDDDAVPEPTWLQRLVAPFADPIVIASTGFIRGRNGISYQWKAMEVDYLGDDHPISIGHSVETRFGSRQRAVKTQGTNCAFRRDALEEIGGFDPAFHFYHDETDVNLRLGEFGLTAIVPDAEVHHGYDASERRTDDRIPLSLHEVAASTAVFLRRHAPQEEWEWGRKALRAVQTDRMDLLRSEGRISDHETARLLETIEQGWADGMMRILTALPPLPAGKSAFLPLPGTGRRDGYTVAGRVWELAQLRTQAEELVEKGNIVTIICLSPTIKPHRLQFQSDGYWLLTGGVFGRSDRKTSRIQLKTFGQRIRDEKKRIGNLRPMG